MYAAVRTLAKVRRAMLLDVMTLVWMDAPPGQGQRRSHPATRDDRPFACPALWVTSGHDCATTGHPGVPLRPFTHLSHGANMPIDVVCPNAECGRTTAAPDAAAGRRIRCPGCQTAVPVPGANSHHSRSATQSGSAPPTAATSQHAGETIGRFIVRGKLGAGAFGTVYRAFDPQLQREVALKVPNAGVLDSPKRVERFLREARSAANLTHPHIVPVFDAGKDGDRYYIASAFIDGKSLADTIPEGGTDFRRAATLARELAEALGYAHSQGVVHRDVKPANCLVNADDDLHLADFGLAAKSDDSTEAKLTNDGAVLGTPAYMAPEQAAGQQGDANPASDQFAVGVVLYELLTGRTPFTGPPAVVLYNVLNTDPEPPSGVRRGIPSDLETICTKAMAKRPEDRYAECQALSDDLRRWLDDEPIAARQLRRTERAVRWVRKNPAVAGAGGAAARRGCVWPGRCRVGRNVSASRAGPDRGRRRARPGGGRPRPIGA